MQCGPGTIYPPIGIAAGATMNRVALEAMILATTRAATICPMDQTSSPPGGVYTPLAQALIIWKDAPFWTVGPPIPQTSSPPLSVTRSGARRTYDPGTQRDPGPPGVRRTGTDTLPPSVKLADPIGFRPTLVNSR